MKALLARPWLVAGLVFLVSAALFWPATGFEFLSYDDDVYVTANPLVRAGLSADSVRAALTSGHAANWHPLTWLSHQLDVTLGGLDPGVHHRTSVLLHALNAALVFLALRALTGAGGASALVALLFALHPLRVESVAWVAERKDVLAGTFFAALLWSHARELATGRRAFRVLTLVLLALGLAAKPMLVSVPLVLLLLERYLGRRFDHARFLAAVPGLVLVLAACLVTLAVQQRGGALEALAELSPGARLVLALRALGEYLVQSVWPSRLAPFHPHPALEESAHLLALGPALALLTLAAGAAFLLRRRAPAVPTGLALFVVMLLPVLGFVPVGLASWAERYTYLPSLGLGLALVFGARALLPARLHATAAGMLFVALLALARVTARTLPHWHDERTLFTHAVAVEPSSVAHVQLANALERAGEREAALRELDAALVRRPELAGARVNRARVLEDLGRADEARAELERALDQDLTLWIARARLGWLLVRAPGDDTAGVAELRAAAATPGADDATQNLLAWVLATSPSAADPAHARRLALELVRRAPGQLAYAETLAAAEARLGNTAEAVRLQEALLPRLPPAARAAAEERLALYRAGKPFLLAP